LALTQLIVLAVLQALTEVLPISAEGHLVLWSRISGWPAPGEGFRLALHVGLILSILGYFWRDLGDMIVGVVRAAKGKRDPGARLALQIFVAAIPVLGLGFAFEHYVAGDWATPVVMGWAIVGYGLLLLLMDRMCMTVKRLEHATFADTMAISLCQVLALVPGTAATGITMTMARALGYERADAARLAFLLALPVLIGVSARDVYQFITIEGETITGMDVVSGAVAFLAGLIGIAILMSWLRRSTFTPFVVYRLLVGVAVLALAYGWVAI
jgi:undecaprenyl-diphosphatase